jgi:uncharacterized protein (UPF0303 family)
MYPSSTTIKKRKIKTVRIFSSKSCMSVFLWLERAQNSMQSKANLSSNLKM